LQTGQGGQGRFPILIRAGERFLKGVISGKNSGGTSDLLITLVDQFFENLCARAQTRVNLSERMLPVSATNNEIGRALEQRKKGNQKEKQPASETAKSKFQR
jgi:hypothetical protein